ncbi:hypothetical protein L484_020987 [Morus notabilis]|uniref:Uncharacterized protein n=1 Tax=Morus notabilis TaxID=981085 RepID=W9QIM3_9ROSA|nr:hypothetical protein L484_020987 [Morus notabilis]
MHDFMHCPESDPSEKGKILHLTEDRRGDYSHGGRLQQQLEEAALPFGCRVKPEMADLASGARQLLTLALLREWYTA